MMTNNKNKLLVYVMIALLIMNTIFTTILWFRTNPPKHEDMRKSVRERFLIENLDLDSIQQSKLDNLMLQHHAQLELFKDKERGYRETLFELLKSDPYDSLVVLNCVNDAAKIKMQIDTSVFYHFKRIRKICNPSQLSKLDSLIENLFLPPPPPPMFREGANSTSSKFEQGDDKLHENQEIENNKNNRFENPPREGRPPRQLNGSRKDGFDENDPERFPDGPPPPGRRFNHPPGRPGRPPHEPPPDEL